MRKILSTDKGFTLVELMVVITIIAILSVMGTVIFTGLQKNARDAKRRADVDAISKAYEANYISGSTTPYAVPQATWLTAGSIPKDPDSNDYFWNGTQSVPTTARLTYTVCAKLESNNGNASSVGDGTTFTAASGSSATHYCQKNQQ